MSMNPAKMSRADAITYLVSLAQSASDLVRKMGGEMLTADRHAQSAGLELDSVSVRLATAEAALDRGDLDGAKQLLSEANQFAAACYSELSSCAGVCAVASQEDGEGLGSQLREMIPAFWEFHAEDHELERLREIDGLAYQEAMLARGREADYQTKEFCEDNPQAALLMGMGNLLGGNNNG